MKALKHWIPLLLICGLATAPALAHRSGHDDDEYDDRPDRHRTYYAPRVQERTYVSHVAYPTSAYASRLPVPRAIHGHSARSYRAYFRGRTFFEPHGHHHTVYAFPVYTPRGRVYRPHFYCNGSLFVAELNTPRFGFHIRF